jgi:hypothetical protein
MLAGFGAIEDCSMLRFVPCEIGRVCHRTEQAIFRQRR